MDIETPDHDAHIKTVVAESPILTIEACSCGVLHLHLGPVSMRFTEDGLTHVQQTIASALRRVAAGRQELKPIAGLFTVKGPVRGEA